MSLRIGHTIGTVQIGHNMPSYNNRDNWYKTDKRYGGDKKIKGWGRASGLYAKFVCITFFKHASITGFGYLRAIFGREVRTSSTMADTPPVSGVPSPERPRYKTPGHSIYLIIIIFFLLLTTSRGLALGPL